MRTLQMVSEIDKEQRAAPAPSIDDAPAFDAYSQAVIGAVQRVGPAVVSLAVAMPAPERLQRRGLPEVQGAGSPRRCSRSGRSEEHTSELQSHSDLVCRLLLE